MKITRAIPEHTDKNMPHYARKPYNDKQWIYLADKLREWANEEDSIYIDVFALNWGYSPYKFKKKWVADNEYFAEAVEYALSVLNCRRNDKLAFDKSLVDRRDWIDKRPLYDVEFKEWIHEQSALKKSEQSKGSDTINVFYDKVRDCPEVKPLKDDTNE